MPRSLLNRSVLALAVTSALPAQAQTLALAEQGFTATRLTSTENLELTGAVHTTGPGMTGVNLSGGNLQGNLINQSSIQVIGPDTVAMRLAGDGNAPLQLDRFINQGTLDASGEGATGLLIDGVAFHQDNQIINNGTIRATQTAIAIVDASVNVATDDPVWGPDRDRQPLTLINTGSLFATGNAIDASATDRQVNVTLNDQSSVRGNLKGLSNIQVLGDVRVDGSLIEVNKPGLFGAKGWLSVGSGFLERTGNLQLQSAHTTLDGNLGINQGSSLSLTLSSTTRPDTPILDVSETAAFGANSQISLTATGSDFSAQGSRYILLRADQLSIANNTLDVVSSSALLSVDSYSFDEHSIQATVTGKGQDAIDQMLLRQGATSNTRAALNAFTSDRVLATLEASNPLLQAFANSDERELAQLASQLTPEINGGATQAAMTSQRLNSEAANRRSAQLREQDSQPSGLWIQGLYNDAAQSRRDSIQGYNAYSRGIAIGADTRINEQLTAGLTYSYITTTLNGSNRNASEVDSQAFTLYGGFTQDNYFVDASLTYGLNSNQSKRDIAGSRAKSDYDSDLLGLNLTAGYTYRITPHVLVEPRLTARYSLVTLDSYREKGSAAALKVDDQRYEAIELGAGLRAASRHAVGSGTLEPHARLMAYHDFAADQARTTSSFALGSSTFASHGAAVARDSYEAGIGVDYHLGAASLGLDYDYYGKSGFDANLLSATLRYQF
ncbi:autotransporter family protein [Pseudomonas sp. ZL2]